MQELWTAVDAYIDGYAVGDDPVLADVLRASDEAGLPAIQVSPSQGKFLCILARIMGARRVLELGTLAGYSTLWLARGIQGATATTRGLGGTEKSRRNTAGTKGTKKVRDTGAIARVVTVESDPKHAGVARENFTRAGFAEMIELREGKGLSVLPDIERDGLGPFDLVFIDADKRSIPAYFEWALRLTRPGSVIVVDNVIRDGKVLDTASDDPDVLGVRRLNEMLAFETRVTATSLQTVGVKGYDGFTIALVNGGRS